MGRKKKSKNYYGKINKLSTDFMKIKTMEKLIDYRNLKKDPKYKYQYYNHSNYFHYTTLENLDSILNEREFWLFPPNVSNDTDEPFKFNELGNVFNFCLSSGSLENLALWSLYSDKKGCRIEFSKNVLRDILNNAEYSIYEYEKCDCGKITTKKPIAEYNAEDLIIEVNDILYYDEKHDKKNVVLMCNNAINNIIPLEKYDIYKQLLKGFLKNNIWYYEKETRVIIKLKNDILDSDKKYLIVMKPRDEDIIRIKIKLAPQAINTEKYDFEKEVLKANKDAINNYEHIKRFLMDVGMEKALKNSKYTGKINMK